MKVNFKIMIILLFIFSCKENEIPKERTTYEILSAVYEPLSISIPAPIPPLGEEITLKDSLEIHQQVLEYRKMQESRDFIVAVDPFLFPIEEIETLKLELKPEFEKLISKLNSIKTRKSFDISRLQTNKNDSIIEFNHSLLIKDHCDFLKFDKRIKFSRIAFNKDKTLAAVIGSAATSCLAGHTSIFFLKMESGNWEIVKTVGLSIS